MNVSLLTCDNLNQGSNSLPYEYPTALGGFNLITQVAHNLQITDTKNCQLFLRNPDGRCAWIDMETPLSAYNPQNGGTIFLLRVSLPIAVMTTDGSTKKMLLDISKTVGELVPFIADKLRLGNSIGYSLFFINSNNEHIPLDLDLSLPEQALDYDKVFFKRRYFIFTRSQIRDRASALLIFNDVRAHIEEKKYSLNPDQQTKLQYYACYAIAPNPSDVRATDIPANIHPSIRENVAAMMMTKSPPTNEEAIEQYLTLAHTIKGFGCEKFMINFSVNNSTNVEAGAIVVGPQNIEVLGADGKPKYTIPYVNYVSSSEKDGTVLFKSLTTNGGELTMNISSPQSNFIHTLMGGYASIIKSTGAELLTEGFAADSGLGSSMDHFPAFAKYYTMREDSKYWLYPGSASNYISKIEPKLESMKWINPTKVSELLRFLNDFKNKPYKQSALLRLIFLTDEFSQNSEFSNSFDEQTINSALLPISTVNITVGGLINLSDRLTILLKCQKILRAEIMIKVNAEKKAEIEQWVNTLKTYKSFLIESIKQLSDNPVSGSLLQSIQDRVTEIYYNLDNLSGFVETIISLSPGSSFLPAIEILKEVTKDTLRPLIPHEPIDRLKHVFKLQQMLFAIALVLAVGNEVVQDPKVSSNQDLLAKLNDVLSSLGNSYSKVHETRKLLTVRPFSLPFITRARSELATLQHDLLSCKSPADLVGSITRNKVFTQVVVFAKKLLEKSSETLAHIRSEPFREIPSVQTLKMLHDSLVDTMAKFLSNNVNITDEASKKLYEKINQQALQIKPIVTFLKMNFESPSRAIFLPIEKAKKILEDAMSQIQALSAMLGDASLVHYFQNILNIINDILANHVPTYSQFTQILKDMVDLIKQEMPIVQDVQLITDNLKIITESSHPDREVSSFQAIKTSIDNQLLDKSIGTAKTVKLKALTGAVNLAILCINQLPLRESVSAPPLNIIPFYSGKEISEMAREIVPQLEDLTKVFKEFRTIPFFIPKKKFISIMEFWEGFFSQMANEIGKMEFSESELLLKIKELVRKKAALNIFCLTIARCLTDFDSFNQQITTFYSNIDIIAEKLIKPHITDKDLQVFNDTVTPKLLQLKDMLQDLPSMMSINNNPTVANNLNKIIQMANTNIALLSKDAQQSFIDNLYDLIQNTINAAKGDPSLNLLVASLEEIQRHLGKFTELSMRNGAGLIANDKDLSAKGGWRNAPTGSIPSKPVGELFDLLINHLDNLSEADLFKLVEMFIRFTADKDSLSPAQRASAAFIKANSIRSYPYDALRTLVHAQANKDLRNEQLRKLAIKFSLIAAQMSDALRPIVSNIQSRPPNQKTAYYAAYMNKFLEDFKPQILLESESFPSVALTYNSIRDIRLALPLLIKESNDQTLIRDSVKFTTMLDQSDLSLSLYFSCATEEILKQCLSIYESVHNDKKSQEVSNLIDIVNDPSILVTSDFSNLSVLSKAIQEIEESIVPIISSNKDVFSQRLISQFQQLKEFKLIMQQWMNPIPEFENEAFRLHALSSLVEAQASFAKVKEVYQTDVLKVPILLNTATSRLSTLSVLAENSKNNIPQIYPRIEALSKTIKAIQSQYDFLSSEEKSYKADIALQQHLPTLFTSVDELITELTAFHEPDYRKLPMLGGASDKQLDLVMSSLENTPFFAEAAKILDYLRSDEKAGQRSPMIEKLIASVINMIPTMADMTDIEVAKSLAEAINEVFTTLTTSGKTLDDFFAEMPKVLAALARLLPTLSERAQELLNLSVVSLMDALNALSTCKKEEIMMRLAPIRAQLTKLATFLAMRQVPDEDLKNRAKHEAANLIVSLNSNNRTQIYSNSINLIAIHAAAADRGINIPLLDQISGDLKVLETQITTLQDKQLVEFRDKFINILTNEIMSLTNQLATVDSLEALLDLRVEHNLTAQGSQIDTIRGLLAIASNVQLMTYRGIELTQNVPPSYTFEYIDKYIMSLNILDSFIETKNRQSLRRFKRFVDNIGDIIDDLLLDGPFDQQLGFAGVKADFINTCASVLASISVFNAGFANAIISSSFNLVITNEVPKISARANVLLQSAGTLMGSNTKTELNTPFANAANQFHSQITALVNNLAKATENTIIKVESQLLSAIHTLASCANQMTDQVPMIYDPEQANRLPKIFTLPILPSDGALLKPQESGRATLMLIQQVNLQNYANFLSTQPPNQQLVDTTLNLYKQINTILGGCLKLSLCSVNLNNKLALTNAANELCKALVQLNKPIRGKCLANPNWIKEAASAIRNVAERMNSIVSLCNEAVQLADTEDSAKRAIRQKIFTVLTPLQSNVNQLDNISEIINEMPPSHVRELMLTLISLSCSGATVLCNILLHAKDHPSDISNFDGTLSKAALMVQLLQSIISSSGNGTKLPTLQQLRDFDRQLIEIFGIVSQQIVSTTPEATQLKEKLTMISKGVETLSETITRSEDESNKPGAHASRFNSPEAQQRLMTRLQLESSVIRFRWKLEFHEKQMAEFA